MKIINLIAILTHLKRYTTQIVSNSFTVFISHVILGIYVHYVKFKNHMKKSSQGTNIVIQKKSSKCCAVNPLVQKCLAKPRTTNTRPPRMRHRMVPHMLPKQMPSPANELFFHSGIPCKSPSTPTISPLRRS